MKKCSFFLVGLLAYFLIFQGECARKQKHVCKADGSCCEGKMNKTSMSKDGEKHVCKADGSCCKGKMEKEMKNKEESAPSDQNKEM